MSLTAAHSSTVASPIVKLNSIRSALAKHLSRNSQLARIMWSRCSIRCSLGVLIFASTTNAASGHVWERLADLNVGRYGAGACELDGRVFVAGGHCGGNCAFPYLTSSVEVYDPSVNAWELVTPLPRALYLPAVVSVANKVYAIGGQDGTTALSSDVYVYDATTDTWSSGVPLPLELSGAAAVAIGSKIFVMGGQSYAGATMATFVYDTAAGEWSRVANFLAGELGSPNSTLSDGAFVYLFGTYDAAGSQFPHVVQRYDPKVDEWRLLHSMITPRRFSAITSVGGYAITLGGIAASPEALVAHESYNLLTNTWTTETRLSGGRWLASAVGLADRVVILGGTLTGDDALTQVESCVVDKMGSATLFCFCDRVSPCANVDMFAGCENSSQRGGLLRGAGSLSILADNLILIGSSLPGDTLCIPLMGNVIRKGVFGDGLKCVGGSRICRSAPVCADSAGLLRLGPGLIESGTFCSFGIGVTSAIQVVFRDAAGPCKSGFNITNGLSVTFAP